MQRGCHGTVQPICRTSASTSTKLSAWLSCMIPRSSHSQTGSETMDFDIYFFFYHVNFFKPPDRFFLPCGFSHTFLHEPEKKILTQSHGSVDLLNE